MRSPPCGRFSLRAMVSFKKTMRVPTLPKSRQPLERQVACNSFHGLPKAQTSTQLKTCGRMSRGQCITDKKKSKTLIELEKVVKSAWKAIPLDRIQVLVDSMPRRIEACIAAKGGPTKY